MTTNKPEVLAYLFEDGEVTLERDYKYPGAVRPKGQGEKLVRLSDYEALQAECERLDRESQNLSDQLGRCDRERLKAMAECEKLREQLESVKELLKDPVTVFVHMKRGIIAKPSLRDLIDLHGDVPNGEDVQLLEITKHRSESERLRKLVEECADYLDHNEHTCIHNGSALHRKLAEAIDAATQENTQ